MINHYIIKTLSSEPFFVNIFHLARWCKLTVSWERLERFQDIIEFALFFPSV